jgi:hypothetical protein
MLRLVTRHLPDHLLAVLPKLMSAHHPSALRNRGPIAAALAEIFAEHGVLLVPAPSALPMLALEFASGTGAHLEVFAKAFKAFTWQPSEYVVPDEIAAGDIGRIGTRDSGVLQVLDAYGVEAFPDNVKPAIALDLSKPFQDWPEAVVSEQGNFSFCFGANITHITDFICTHGLLEGAGKALRDGGILCVYGPFKVNGEFTGDGGNEKFDASLKQRNSAWGYREIEVVVGIARQHRLELRNQVEMPANNFLLCFQKMAASVGRVQAEV